MSKPLETYEVGSPWVTYHYQTTDAQTRITGRSKILLACAICGHEEVLTLRIPRVGPVPEPQGGRHPDRVAFVRAHQHTGEERRDRTTWAKPLRNPAGLNLGDLADIVTDALNRDLGDQHG
jgi:hypothetical protein